MRTADPSDLFKVLLEVVSSAPFTARREVSLTKHHVSKRDAFGKFAKGFVDGSILGPIGGVVGGFICLFFCPDPPPPNQPPNFDSCYGPTDQFADYGQRSTVVSWPSPSASDNEDGTLSVSLVQGSPPGSTFESGSHTIIYRASDSRGATTHCYFSFKVTVISCNPIVWPLHGYVRCDKAEFIYGSKCTLSCFEGYEMANSSTEEPTIITCDKTSDNLPVLDKPLPTCKAITCPANDPALIPENGQAICTHSNYKYDTACITQCKNGYSLSSGQLFSSCKADKTWSSELPDCKDSESPEISNCPGTIFAYTDRNSRTASVSWLEPLATDNQGSAILNRTKGPAPGSIFNIGFTEIRYRAEDAEGNVSPECSFFVNVEEVRCDPPLIVDKYLFYQCPNGYTYGSTCQLRCMGSFPLIGNDTITCERNDSFSPPLGYWDMGDAEPFCQKNPCDILPPPENGAMVCDTWLFGMQCQMQCSDKYDIPYGTVGSNGAPFTGLFTCSESKGEYTPSNNVPGCTEFRRPGMTTVLGEFFYYTGNCNDLTVLDDIKENFIDKMQLLETQGWNGVCPTQIDCNVNNTVVTCGPVTGRRKRDISNFFRVERSTHEIRVELTMITTWYNFNSTGGSTFYFLEEIQKKVFNVIKSSASNGNLTVRGLSPDLNSFVLGWSDPYCPEGSIIRWSTLTCVPCAAGTYLDKSDAMNPACVECPVGTYKDNDISCTACPAMTSTLTNGTQNFTDCLKKCQPGEYSTTGLEPCHFCPRSSYQNAESSRSCMDCPAGKTSYPGSTSISNCSDFDLVLSNASSETLFFPASTAQVAFSFMTWINPSQTRANISLFQTKSTAFTLNVYYTNELFIEINSKSIQANVTFPIALWSHLLVRVTSVTSSLTVFLNGVSVLHTPISSYVPAGSTLIDDTSQLSLELYEDTRTGYYISEYQVEFTALSDAEVASVATSCHMKRTEAQITMDTFKNFSHVTGQKLLIHSPSVCDNVNQCIPNPCNDHECQDRVNSYKCLCTNGYHGENCQNPPDYCQGHPCKNGGTCTPATSNFTCTCPTGYKGFICEIRTVNGGWSTWGSYSECSVSCGGGQKSRTRLCNSPTPDPDGIPCNSSESTETTLCNTVICPSCPSIQRGFGNILNCTNTADGHKLCTLQCRPGLTFMFGNLPLPLYICGVNTSYIWNGKPPSCGRISSPSRISTLSNVQYSTSIPCDSSSNAAAKLKNSLESDLQCSVNKSCSINVDVPGCPAVGVRRRRSTASDTQTITLSYNLTAGDNLDLQLFYESNNASRNLQELLFALSELEASASQINSSHSILSFELNGVQYTSEAVSTDSVVECSPGQGRQEAFCIDCPFGTYSFSNNCPLCPLGSYQDEEAQIYCKPCPLGMKTTAEGSQNISECSVTIESTTFVPSSTVTNMTSPGSAYISSTISTLISSESSQNTSDISTTLDTPVLINTTFSSQPTMESRSSSATTFTGQSTTIPPTTFIRSTSESQPTQEAMTSKAHHFTTTPDPLITLSSNNQATKRSKERNNEDGSKAVVIAVGIIGTIFVLLSSIVLSMLFHKKCQRARHRRDLSLVGSWVSLNMVKPQYSDMSAKTNFSSNFTLSGKEHGFSKSYT
ncbi:sushi, von Willebrand factor type A, EGF and pentraxin domain-containing protein 1-like [Saccostrea echinata]|uniref:sushi, von Willebrand factor type A, EGF and pentraxin domain-containing protein 1-like n=1 Tax=Saccostrea echinata TaxID=191078 RepID=UPI002A8037C3|nr:sushi, von Willebrand factor type A, EGF and pentraxin domain-containing protein 1-like [Saccostrea echinata]